MSYNKPFIDQARVDQKTEYWPPSLFAVLWTSSRSIKTQEENLANIHPAILTSCLVSNCCGASVASEQQHKQDLRRIYKREYEFSNSPLFSTMHCIYPDCTAPLITRVHRATNNTRMSHLGQGSTRWIGYCAQIDSKYLKYGTAGCRVFWKSCPETTERLQNLIPYLATS